jgi:hypothetical protein
MSGGLWGPGLSWVSSGARSVGRADRPLEPHGGSHDAPPPLISRPAVRCRTRRAGRLRRRWLRCRETGARGGSSAAAVPLKDAKLNIEHNATDKDTGFQGFIDSEGWRRLDVRGPNGEVLAFEGRGSLGELGLTELFFETVEPENANVPIEQMLAKATRGELHDRRPGPGERREHRPDLRDCVADARHPGGPEADLPSGRCTGPGTRGGRPLEAPSPRRSLASP